MRRLIVIAGFLGVTLLLTLAQGGTRYRLDYGRQRVIVLQSDDWGLEAWFPDAASAEALSDAVAGIPERLRPYATSTLESASEVDSLAAFLSGFVDADGLPAILQANTVVAALDAAPPASENGAPEYGFQLRAPGSGVGPYARPGLWEAYGRAVDAGVWRMELHGFAHRDLARYASAWEQGDELTRRAAEWGVIAHEGWRRRHELAKGDLARSRLTLSAAMQRFETLAGHPAVSFIAPDYHWDSSDEKALRELGIGVIQGKAEQINPRWSRGGVRARLLKRWEQQRERRAAGVLYMDRPARLEPYGESDPSAAQGAEAAANAVRAAWRRGEPGVVSIHRVQLVHPEEAIKRAGRRQLEALFEELGGAHTLRFLVDAELVALEREGISAIRRGSRWVYRNFEAQPRSLKTVSGQTIVVAPGTTTRSAGEVEGSLR